MEMLHLLSERALLIQALPTMALMAKKDWLVKLSA